MKTLILSLILIASALAYEPPIGIPDPAEFWAEFGEIDQPTPAWPASWLSGTTTATDNYYYIDNTHPSATDSSNPFGHPQLPRATFPGSLSFSAGTYIYCHAGSYSAPLEDLRGVGTAASPIWLTGNASNRPILTNAAHFGRGASGDTSYWIMENLFFSGPPAGINIRPTVDGQSIDHVLIRNIKIQQTGTAADAGGILVGISSTDDTIPNSTITDVVVYNCDISYCGDRITTDTTGVYNGFHTDRVWVSDNLIHHVGADSIAGSHFSNRTTQTTNNYYIGRNTLYGNGENGIDIKAATGVIISQNTIYGPFEREQGAAIVLHSGAPPAVRVEDCAVIFNRIYHCSAGIQTGFSHGADNMQITGNLFYDIKSSYSAVTDPGINGLCIQLGGSNGDFHISNNTFHDYDRGILLGDVGSSDNIYIHGNVFANRFLAAEHDIDVFGGSAASARVDLSNNCYYQPTHGASWQWDGATRDLAYMQGTAGEEVGSITSDPLFLNPATGNFTIPSASPLVGASTQGAAYAAFAAMFPGRSAEFDFRGGGRPSATTWDIGAVEHNAPGAAPEPPISVVATAQ